MQIPEMKTRLKVEVTEQDIANGHRRDPKTCPVGRALTRATPGNFRVLGPVVILGNETRATAAVLLPDFVRNWIADFDRSKPVQPISFDLGTPLPVGCRCAQPGHANARRCSETNADKDGHGSCPLLLSTMDAPRSVNE